MAQGRSPRSKKRRKSVLGGFLRGLRWGAGKRKRERERRERGYEADGSGEQELGHAQRAQLRGGLPHHYPATCRTDELRARM